MKAVKHILSLFGYALAKKKQNHFKRRHWLFKDPKPTPVSHSSKQKTGSRTIITLLLQHLVRTDKDVCPIS